MNNITKIKNLIEELKENEERKNHRFNYYVNQIENILIEMELMKK